MGAAEHDDDDTDRQIEARAQARTYWRARTATNIGLAVVPVAIVAIWLLDPRPSRGEAGPDPIATAEVLAYVALAIATTCAYVFHGRMARCQGWLTAVLGEVPPRDAPDDLPPAPGSRS